ncbi:MAG: hypothetical protein ACT4O0_14120 [Pseudonocardia sp.]|jgi:hypothetical protein
MPTRRDTDHESGHHGIDPFGGSVAPVVAPHRPAASPESGPAPWATGPSHGPALDMHPDQGADHDPATYERAATPRGAFRSRVSRARNPRASTTRPITTGRPTPAQPATTEPPTTAQPATGPTVSPTAAVAQAVPAAGWTGWTAVAAVLGLLAVCAVAALVYGLAEDSAADAARGEALDYPVPAGWARTPGAPGSSAGGITLDAVATVGAYSCQGARHSRATVGRTFAVRGDGSPSRPEEAVRDFGAMFAVSFYGAAATVATRSPARVEIGGVTGFRSDLTVTPLAGTGACPSPTGAITVVSVPTERRGPTGSSGVLLVVLQRDTAGGPAESALIGDAAATEVLDNLRVVRPPVAR